MARIDKIKNLSGLVEIYAQSAELKESANLFIVSSLIDAAKSEDQEEIEEIHRIYHLIEQHGLDGKIRWCAARLNKVETGEIYRIVADRKGVFAQPALMETFGLTVVEAMACGLPVVVTCFGGPSEIVVPGSCGEVENPNQHEAFAGALQRILRQEDVWEKYSINGIKRSNENFSWVTHAQRILKMTNVYSYWNYLDVMNRSALDQYIHTLYHTVYRPRAQSMLEEELSHVHSDD
jgi:sucrose synthase